MIKKSIQNLLWKFNYDISKIFSIENNFKDLIYRLHPIRLKNCELIRVGNPLGDGGYLIPDLLTNIKYAFSLGVGPDSTFENDLASQNIKCFMADFSVNGPNINNKNFNFTKKFIKSYNSLSSSRFNDWKNECIGEDNNSGIILQVDIEGDEYSVIPTIDNNTLLQTEIMIVEFHHLTRILNHDYQKYIINCFERILEYFEPVHLHVNNSSSVLFKNNIGIPHLLEATFINKKLIKDKNHEYVKIFPNKLDQPNISSKEDVKLPYNWYRI